MPVLGLASEALVGARNIALLSGLVFQALQKYRQELLMADTKLKNVHVEVALYLWENGATA